MSRKSNPEKLPVIAIVGRPNVGKSTLFNRLLRRGKAITHDRPGVTRDRLEELARFAGASFLLVDTGGLVPGTSDNMEELVTRQAEMAVKEADLILFLVDGRVGPTGGDYNVAEHLRSFDREVLLIVNKVDGPELEPRLTAEFYSFGWEILAVSAAHGFGMEALKERIAELLRPAPDEEATILKSAPDYSALEDEEQPEDQEKEDFSRDKTLRLAVLGRPNAGKSSLINALVGENRLIVSETAGTTRDAVDISFALGDRSLIFVDTAGVRRKSRIDDSLERVSVSKAMSAAKRADVALVVLELPQDEFVGISSQDKRLIAFLEKEKTAFIILVNKMDVISGKEKLKMQKFLQEALRFCAYVPILYISALTGENLKKILPLAEQIVEDGNKRFSTGELNRVAEFILKRQAPLVNGRRAKFYYLTQVDVAPPTFVFFVNDPELVLSSYSRFIENALRKHLGFGHSPVRVYFRSSHSS